MISARSGLRSLVLSESPKKLSDEAYKGINDYALRLSALLALCAQQRGTDPETFLWNARRCTEAICHILITAETNKVSTTEVLKDEGSLAGMIEKLRGYKVLDTEQNTRFRSLREHTNLGVHIRSPQQEEYAVAVDDVATLLPKVVRWLVLESRARPHIEGGKALIKAADRIPNGSPSLEPMLVLPPRESDGARRELERRLQETQEKLQQAHRQLAAVEPDQIKTVPAAPKSAQQQKHPDRSPTLQIVLVAGLCGLVGAMASAWWMNRIWTAQEPELVLDLSGRSERTAQAGEAIVENGPPQDLPAPDMSATVVGTQLARIAPDPVAPPANPSCPAGMLLIQGDTVTLGQPEPDRGGWPAPTRRKIAPIDVASFCVDPKPRKRDEVLSWAGGVSVSVGKCPTRRDKDQDPTTVCVLHETARDFCGDTVADGRLLTIPEWELLMRSEQATAAQVNSFEEWAEDTFPPTVLNRPSKGCTGTSCGAGMWRRYVPEVATLPPEGNVLNSWNRSDKADGQDKLFFRCAVTLSEAAPQTTGPQNSTAE